MRRRTYMKSPLMARTCSKGSLEWKVLSKKGYQEEALMEGKKITTSILPLAIDLREIERWRSKEQEEEEEPRAGLEPFFFSRSCKKMRREKNSSLYRQWLWVPQLKVQNGLKHRSTGFGRIRRRRKN